MHIQLLKRDSEGGTGGEVYEKAFAFCGSAAKHRVVGLGHCWSAGLGDARNGGI